MDIGIDYIDIKSKLKTLYELKIKENSSLHKINSIAAIYNYIVRTQRENKNLNSMDIFLEFIELARTNSVEVPDNDNEYIISLGEKLIAKPNNKLIELCGELNSIGPNNLYIKEYFIFGESYFYMQDCTMAYTLNEGGLYFAIPIIELNKCECRFIDYIDNNNCIVVDNRFEIERLYFFFVNNNLEQPEKLLSE